MPESLVGMKVHRIKTFRPDAQFLPIEGYVEKEEELSVGDGYLNFITVNGQSMSEGIFLMFYEVE